MKSVRAIVMASGFSTRFGRNKLEYVLDGQSVISRVLSAIPGDFEPIVVTRYPSVKRLAEEMGFTSVGNDFPCLRDTIRLGLDAVGDCQGAMFMVADQPFIRRETLLRLREVFLSDPRLIVRAASGSRPGNPVIFPASLFGELRSLGEDESGSTVIKRHMALQRFVEAGEEELCDVDRPTDL